MCEQFVDPSSVAVLKERLSANCAELQGQLPELLLRSQKPEEAIRSWLSDKDLSHWWPQAHGGTAEQGWQFETASWNRSRGAEPMSAVDIGRAQLDGGIDALHAPGVAEDITKHCLEAGVLAALLTISWSILRDQECGMKNSPLDSRDYFIQSLKDAGFATTQAMSASLAVSLALSFIPGAQAWLLAGSICSASKSLQSDIDKSFNLR